MKYLVQNIDVHSDRSAIPSGRKSKTVTKYLDEIRGKGTCVDYGCGKLRHLHEMLRAFSRITLVDSRAQLEKVQEIHGKRTSIRDFCKRYRRRVRVIAAEEVGTLLMKHDHAMCIHVLSAIPSVQARYKVLRNIARLLKPDGEIFAVTQFRNSKFQTFENGLKHLDGYIYWSPKGAHFFGRIPRLVLRRYLTRCGFKDVQISLDDGYAIARALN